MIAQEGESGYKTGIGKKLKPISAAVDGTHQGGAAGVNGIGIGGVESKCTCAVRKIELVVGDAAVLRKVGARHIAAKEELIGIEVRKSGDKDRTTAAGT